MHRRLLIILILFVVICTAFIGTRVNAESELTIKLKENLIPLKSTEAGNGFEDLMGMKEIFKDKKIIAMGEATHGTAEFFQMKHRIFEFLVEEMNYRVFAIEAAFGGAQVVNDYILNGEGNVYKCLDAMGFWTWDTKEVADMIQWMREYNEKTNRDNRIKFYGFDMQGINNSVKYVLDYLGKVESVFVDNHKAKLIGAGNNFYTPKKSNLNVFSRDIDNIYNEIVNNKENYIKNSSIEEYELILHHIKTIYQWIDFLKNNSFDNRDYYMAENVKWILDFENKHYGNDKIMLWAHNGHIANTDDNYKIMGNNLKDFYNEDYYSLGFDFYQGKFVAMQHKLISTIIGSGLTVFNIDSSPKDSLAHEIMKTDIPIGFLDIKNAEKDKMLLDFLSTKIHVNGIGAIYFGKSSNINHMNEIIIKDTFDGIIFVKSTTEAKRSRSMNTLPNGNKILLYSSIFIVTLITIIFILLLRLLWKRKSSSESTDQKNYYILVKDREEKLDNNIIQKLIIKANNYINSLSNFKYNVFIILIITILTSISVISNTINIYSSIYANQGMVTILINLIVVTFMGIGEVFIVFILPLNIIKRLSKEKEIYLNQIILASVIGTVINSLGYLHSGILLYSFMVLLSFIEGIIICYSYGLFYYKWKQPFTNISIILAIHNILMVILAIFVFNF